MTHHNTMLKCLCKALGRLRQVPWEDKANVGCYRSAAELREELPAYLE